MEFYVDKLKEARKKQRLTTDEIAEKIGVHRSTMFRWLNKQVLPSEANIRMMAKALNVSVEEISDLQAEQPMSEVKYSGAVRLWESLESEDKDAADVNLILSGVSVLKEKLNNAKIIIDALRSSITSIFYIKDTKLNYVLVNSAFLENLSLNKHYRVNKKKDSDFFPAKEAMDNNEEDRLVLFNGKKRHREGYIPGSRKKKWGLIYKIPIFNNEKSIQGIVALFVDITEKKKLEHRRELLELNINAMIDGVGLYSFVDNKFLYINRAIEIITGYKLENFYNTRDFWLNNCVHPDDKKEQQVRAFGIKKDTYSEYRIVKPDGEVRWIAAHSSFKKFSNQDCSLTITRDITDEKSNNQEKEILYKLLDRTEDVICVYDVDNKKYTYINSAMEKLTGYPVDNFYNSDDDFFNTCLSSSDKKKRRKCVDEKSWPLNNRYVLTRQDGSQRICESSINRANIFGKDSIIIVIRDITEHKQYIDQIGYLEETLNAMSIALNFVDLQNRKTLYANEAYHKMCEILLGCSYSDEKFLSNPDNLKSWINKTVVKPEEREKILNYMITGKWPERFDCLYKMPDDSLHWIETLVFTKKYLGNDCAASVSRDITEIKRGDEMHKLLKTQLEITSTAIVIRNGNKILYANKVLEDIYGYPLEKIKEGYFDFRINTCVHPDDREQVKCRGEKYAKNKKWPIKTEHRIIKPDGEIRWIGSTVARMEYFGELCYAGIIKDITEEKQAYEIKEIFGLIIDTMSDGVTLRALNTSKYIFLNKAIESIYGYPLEKFYKNGLSFWLNTCLHPEDKNKELKYIKADKWPENRKFRIIRPNGEVRYIETVLLREIIYQGKNCVLLVDIDVTDKVLLKQKVGEQAKEIEKLKLMVNKA